MVLDHIEWTHAVSPPLHTIYVYRTGKAVTLNNSLAPKSSTFTFRKDSEECRASQHLVKLLDDPRMENMMVFICSWMHKGKEVELGPKRYKLYEELRDCALKFLINTPE